MHYFDFITCPLNSLLLQQFVPNYATNILDFPMYPLSSAVLLAVEYSLTSHSLS